MDAACVGNQHQAPQLLAAPFRVKDGGCKWPGAMVSRHGTAVDAKLGGAATLDERADAAAPRRQPAGVRFNFLEGGCVPVAVAGRRAAGRARADVLQ